MPSIVPTFLEVVNIFDWLGDILGGIGSAVGGVFDTIGDQVSAAIWDAMIRWFYNTIFDAASDFFTMMGNMGADIFNLSWWRIMRSKAPPRLSHDESV